MRLDNKPIAIYEKALPHKHTLDAVIAEASSAGYAAIEISVDDQPERLARLNWSRDDVANVLASLERHSMSIQSITLSAHRSMPLGSADPDIQDTALDIGRQAIAIAEQLSIPFVQIAGYFATDADRSPDSRAVFCEHLDTLAGIAQRAGVMLALENVDGIDVLSADDGIAIVTEVNSPALRLYVDVGNFAANGLDTLAEVTKAMPYACAMQLKDALPGVFRRVSFGSGIVPFRELFEECIVDVTSLPLSLEMWNDSDSSEPAVEAYQWFRELWTDVNSYRWGQLQVDDHGHSH